jgi:predicted nucleic acid-binding protein
LTPDLIVADAGPLIGLAIAGRIEILGTLFEKILIPQAVLEELQIEASRPGSFALSKAKEEGWLSVEDVPENTDMTQLTELLDRGEAEAIVLAQSKDARLLIDERKGRAVARSRGVIVIGTGGVLLLAKRQHVIDQIAPILDELASHGYRLSDALRRELLVLAGEA